MAFFRKKSKALTDQQAARLTGEMSTNPKYTAAGIRAAIEEKLFAYLNSRASLSATKTVKRSNVEPLFSCREKQYIVRVQKANTSSDSSASYQFQQLVKHHKDMSAAALLEKYQKKNQYFKGGGSQQDVKERLYAYDRYDNPFGMDCKFTKQTDITGAIEYDVTHRDAQLVKDRVNLMLQLLIDIDKTLKDSETQDPGKQLEQIEELVSKAIEANEALDGTSLKRNPKAHHDHQCGSRFPFFGSGTLFQSQAARTLHDCMAKLETALSARKVAMKSIAHLEEQAHSQLTAK